MASTFYREKYAGLVLLLFGALLSIITAYSLEFNGLYGQDAYKYLSFSQSIGSLAYERMMWPINYPLAGRIMNFLIADPAKAIQFISVIAYSFSGWLIYDILKQTYSVKRIVILSYVVIFFSFSPYIFRFSTLVMSEMLCVFFIVLTFHQGFRKEIRNHNLIYTVVAATLAIGTRYVALLVVIVPVINVLIKCIASRRFVLVTISIASGLLFWLPQLLFKDYHSSDHINHNFLHSWSPVNFFQSSFQLEGGRIYQYTNSNIIEVLSYFSHPVFNFAGLLLTILFLVLVFRRNINPPHLVYWLSFTIYTLFLMGLPVQNRRFFIIIYPVFIIMLFPAWKYLNEMLSRNWLGALSISALFTQIGFTVIAEKTVIDIHHKEIEYIRKLKEFNSDNIPVYNTGLDGMIKFELPETEFYSLHDTLKIPNGRIILMIDSQQVIENFRGSQLQRNVEVIYQEMSIARRSETDRWKLYEFSN